MLQLTTRRDGRHRRLSSYGMRKPVATYASPICPLLMHTQGDRLDAYLRIRMAILSGIVLLMHLLSLGHKILIT